LYVPISSNVPIPEGVEISVNLAGPENDDGSLTEVVIDESFSLSNTAITGVAFANLAVSLNTNSPLEFNKGGNLDNFEISNLDFNLNDPEKTSIIIGGISNVTVEGLTLNPAPAAVARRQRRLNSEK
jgi:hypothetical protein